EQLLCGERIDRALSGCPSAPQQADDQRPASPQARGGCQDARLVRVRAAHCRAVPARSSRACSRTRARPCSRARHRSRNRRLRSASAPDNRRVVWRRAALRAYVDLPRSMPAALPARSPRARVAHRFAVSCRNVRLDHGRASPILGLRSTCPSLLILPFPGLTKNGSEAPSCAVRIRTLIGAGRKSRADEQALRRDVASVILSPDLVDGKGVECGSNERANRFAAEAVRAVRGLEHQADLRPATLEIDLLNAADADRPIFGIAAAGYAHVELARRVASAHAQRGFEIFERLLFGERWTHEMHRFLIREQRAEHA